MSQLRTGPDRQRLLPSAVEHSLNDLAIRISGGALLAFAVTSWLALLSWQMRDAAFPNAVVKSGRNLLGSFGAGLSDMMVQTVGIAAVFALLCPMIWGMELLANVRWIPRFRIKLIAFIGSLLFLAGMASGLPAIPGWPLLGGAGGMLGDLVFNLSATTAHRYGIDKTGWLPVLILGMAGLACLASALGIKLRGLFKRTDVTSGRSTVAPAAGSPASAQAGPASPQAVPDPVATGEAGEAPVAAVATTRTRRPIARVSEGVSQSAYESAADVTDATDAMPASGSAADDEESDQTARAFAERFAPGVATAKSTERQRLVPALKATLARARQPAAWRKPSLNLLRRGQEQARANTIDVESGANQLIDVLAAFGVKGEIKEARSGPVVTRYELEPARGTKISRVIGLADDFARELGAHAVRVSVTPGRTTIGIEVPNEMRESVMLRDILESEPFTANPAQLPLALGKGIGGEAVVLDLARMPHLLVAGTTGSGKSVGLNSMLLSLIYRLDPSELRLMLIDPKMLEMAQYDRIPHLLNPVITDPQEAALALEWTVGEMEERYKRMALHGTRNIEAFNARIRSAREKGQSLTRTVQTGFDPRTGRAIYEHQTLDDEVLPFIVIVIDELADLMLSAGKRIDGSLQRLAQKARAAGIHLVMATQRPSVDVVTGTIKANFPVRISFRVASKIDSRTILNEQGAEQLLGHGDMLLTAGSGQHLRVHGAYVADEEIERVVQALREQGEPQYVELAAHAVEPTDGRRSGGGKSGSNVVSAKEARGSARSEEAYATAVATVVADRKASAGHLHRRLAIPESEAMQHIERMEAEGLIAPPNMFGRRAILIKAQPAAPPVQRSAA